MPEDVTCVRCHSTEGNLDATGVCATCRSRTGHSDTPGESGTVFNPPPPVRPFDRTATDHLDLDHTRTVDGSTGAALPPQTLSFSNYELHEVIGRGGMGLVYRATQKRANRVVALKVLAGAAEFDDRQKHRFQGEAESLARSRHPGIVEIYEVGEENGRPFFSMEYVPGGTLARAIRSGAKPDVKRSAGLIAAVARAVDAAHGVGVIHRDLKPSNILLAANGTPKVADFGLAVLTDRDSRLTSSGALLGTPSYMSPEQAAGKKDEIGARTDVYALGATLYELLTGQPPFKADTSVATAVKVLNDVLVPPRKLNSAVPPDLEAVCLKCLEKDPANRYASAAALADDLDTWAADKPTTARPVSAGQRVWTAFKRRRAPVAGVGLALLAVAAVAVALLVPDDPKKAMLARLKRGEEVVVPLIHGEPAYQKWEFTPAKIGPTQTPGTWGFQTQVDSFLELCPDTTTDHYQFTGEIQHVKAEQAQSRIGFFLRSLDPLSVNGRAVSHWVLVGFNDFPPLASKPSNLALASMGIELADGLNLSVSEADQLPTRFLTKTYPFPPSKSEPRPFRPFRVVVTPDGLTINVVSETGEEVETHRVSKEDMVTQRSKWQAQLDNYAKSVGVPAPPWTPRAAVGVFAKASTVAVRNVTITPNPQGSRP